MLEESKKMFDIKLNTPFTVNNVIETNGLIKNKIAECLRKILDESTFQKITFPNYFFNQCGEDEFWDINCTTNYIKIKIGGPIKKISGSLPKRLRKYLYLAHDIKLSQNDMGRLGETIRRIKNQTIMLTCKFVDHFDWEHGDFDDYKSCFWTTSRHYAKDLLLDYGANPILFFDETGAGIGRAITINRKDYLIIFNAYGFDLKEVAIILSKYFRCKYKIKTVIKDLDPYDLVYINDAEAAILYYDRQIDNQSMYINIDINTSDYSICETCDEFYCTDNLIRLANEDSLYCKDCLDCINHFECDKCGKIFIEDSYTPSFYIEDIGKLVCTECFNTYNAFQCDNCGKFYTAQTPSYFDKRMNSNICENCVINDDYKICVYCKNIISGHIMTVGDGFCCLECAKEEI